MIRIIYKYETIVDLLVKIYKLTLVNHMNNSLLLQHLLILANNIFIKIKIKGWTVN